jgi:hypothetical protein
LHVHGGGGEVFRNFFNLLDRGMNLRQFVWMFYSQYNRDDCAVDFDPAGYENAIGAKISDLLGIQTPHLDRREVESLYPYFRCRSWFGRENSVNNRFGYSVLPFYEREIVDMALAVPIRHKHFGDFEARMIRAAYPALAAHRSNYGHSFVANAPLWTRLAALATYSRPLALRRYGYGIKTRLQVADPRAAMLAPEFLCCVVAPDLPRMARYFRMSRVHSNAQFNRIATLEYLFDQLGAE